MAEVVPAFASRGGNASKLASVSSNNQIPKIKNKMEYYVIDAVSRERQKDRVAVFVEGDKLGLDKGLFVLVEKKDIRMAEEIARSYLETNSHLSTAMAVDVSSRKAGVEVVPQLLEIFDHMSQRAKDVLIFADNDMSQLRYIAKTLDALGFTYKIKWFDGVPMITEIMKRGQKNGWGWQITINGEMPYIEKDGQRIYLSADKIMMTHSANTRLSYDYTVIAQQKETGEYIFEELLHSGATNEIKKTREYALQELRTQDLPFLFQPKLDDCFLGKPDEYFASEIKDGSLSVQKISLNVLPVERFASSGAHVANILEFFLYRDTTNVHPIAHPREDFLRRRARSYFGLADRHQAPSLIESQMRLAGSLPSSKQMDEFDEKELGVGVWSFPKLQDSQKEGKPSDGTLPPKGGGGSWQGGASLTKPKTGQAAKQPVALTSPNSLLKKQVNLPESKEKPVAGKEDQRGLGAGIAPRQPAQAREVRQAMAGFEKTARKAAKKEPENLPRKEKKRGAQLSRKEKEGNKLARKEEKKESGLSRKEERKIQRALEGLAGKKTGKAYSNSLKRKFRAILFDMDGVLARSENLHRKAFNELLKKFGIFVGEKEWGKKYAGIGAPRIMKDLFARHKVNEDHMGWVKRRSKKFMQMLDSHKLPITPGAKEAIKWAELHGIKVMVVSGGHGKSVRKMLKNMGILGLKAIGREDVRDSKPDPEPYLLASRRLGISPKDCLVFEDSPAGVKAAQGAGMLCVGVLTTNGKGRLRRAGADFFVKDFRDKRLAKLLFLLFGKGFSAG